MSKVKVFQLARTIVAISWLASTVFYGTSKESLEAYLLRGDIEGAEAWLRDIHSESQKTFMKTFITLVVEPYLRDAVYAYKDEFPWLEIRPPLGKPLIFSVPAAKVVDRFLCWVVSKSIGDVVWVADGSDALRAMQAWEKAALDLTRPVILLLSCPHEWYEKPAQRTAWTAAVAELKEYAAATGLPVTVVDLSELPEEKAKEEVEKYLALGGTQVLGFFHRVDESAFEIGVGGRLSKEDIQTIGHRMPPDQRFIAIVGCNPLFFGLSDMFISSGLTQVTFTVGKKFDAVELFRCLRTFLDIIREELKHGRNAVPLPEIQKRLRELIDLQIMAWRSREVRAGV